MPKLNGSEDGLEVVDKLAEGNPGAMNVLMDVVTAAVDGLEAMQVMYTLDAMEIHGPRIWLCYKDFAGGDLRKMITGVQSRDQKMIDICNEQHPGEPHAKSDLA